MKAAGDESDGRISGEFFEKMPVFMDSSISCSSQFGAETSILSIFFCCFSF
jgi:hypothetical protein